MTFLQLDLPSQLNPFALLTDRVYLNAIPTQRLPFPVEVVPLLARVFVA